MKLAIAQINCVMGDLKENSAKLLYAAELLLTPELSLFGYPRRFVVARWPSRHDVLHVNQRADFSISHQFQRAVKAGGMLM